MQADKIEPSSVGAAVSGGEGQPVSTHYFNKSYVKSNHLQQRHNSEHLPIFCQKIEEYYKSQKISKPLKIVDLCCGHGGPTIDLYRELVRLKVEVEEVVGLDVSAELIGIAVERSKEEGLDKKLRFQRVDMDVDMGGIAEVDAVVSFFGLHWAKDIEKVGKNIAGMLKNGGVFCALVPVEVNTFFTVRQNFINTSKWSTIFQGPSKILKSFHGTAEPYRKAYSPYFTSQKDDFIKPPNHYTLQLLIICLRSWMQEIRYLMDRQQNEENKERVAQEYLSELIASTPYIEKEVEKVGEDQYFYYQPLHVFIGTKKQ